MKVTNKILIGFLISLPLLGLSSRVFGAVASSPSYQLEKDSINFSGAVSESTNYGLDDTVGEGASGDSTSSTYALRAGYQAMEVASTYITLSAPSDVSLASIANDTGGQSSGTAVWTVTTNNSAGYTLAIKASTDPALTASGGSFTDYSPSGADPDFTWSVGASAVAFGFSPEGSNIVTRFKDNGSSCNTGSSDTSASCWDGFSTTNQTIASSNSSNHPSGVTTTVRFRAEIGSTATLSAGSYTSAITVTAVTL